MQSVQDALTNDKVSIKMTKMVGGAYHTRLSCTYISPTFVLLYSCVGALDS